MKTKTGTAWGPIGALVCLITQVEASTVSFVSNPTVTTGQIFSVDMIFNV